MTRVGSPGAQARPRSALAGAALALLCAACHAGSALAAGKDLPQPPCAVAAAPEHPAPAPPDAPPTVRAWSGAQLAGWSPPACTGWPAAQRFRLVVALAGQIHFPGDADALRARIGAVSATRGLRYWSVTDRDWRELFTDAFALDGPDLLRRRADFAPAELKPGAELFFAQDESRTSGLTIYRTRVLESAPSRIVIETVNVGALYAFGVTIFPPGALRAAWIIEQRGPRRWRYYGLSGIGESASALAPANEASAINRMAALYRYLGGVPGDREPPLAR